VLYPFLRLSSGYCRHDFPNPLSPGKLLLQLLFCITHTHTHVQQYIRWLHFILVSFSLQKISLHDVYKQSSPDMNKNYKTIMKVL